MFNPYQQRHVGTEMPVEQKGNIINLEPEASASCKNQQLHVNKIIYTSIHQIFWFTRS